MCQTTALIVGISGHKLGNFLYYENQRKVFNFKALPTTSRPDPKK